MWEALGGGDRLPNSSSRRVRLPAIGSPSAAANQDETTNEEAKPNSLVPVRDTSSSIGQQAFDVTSLTGLKSPLLHQPTLAPPIPNPPRLSGHDDVSGARLMHIESRLAAAERSNRAFLEELVRWQSDLKAVSRQQDEARREEQRQLLQLRANTASNNDDITQLTSKLQTNEDVLLSTRQHQHNLNDQLKRLQQAVIDNHQTTIVHHDQLNLRLERWQQDMKHTTEHLSRSRDETEKHIARLAEDVRQLRATQANRTIEFQATLTEMRTNIKRCFAEQQGIMANASENQTKLVQLTAECSKLAPVVYDGLKHVEKAVGEVQNSLSYHERDEESRLAALAAKVKDLDSAHSTRVAQSDQKLEGLEKALRDMNQHLDAERSQTTQQLGSFIDMQRKDVADITSRLEETFQKQITNLSDALEKEKEGRVLMASVCQQDIVSRGDLLRKEIHEQLVDINAVVQGHKHSVSGTLRQLHESIRLNEEQLSRTQQNIEKVVHAEIQTRQADDERQTRVTGKVNERFEMALASVQQSIAALSAQVVDSSEKVQLQWKTDLADHAQTVGRGTTDVDMRMNTLAARMGAMESAAQTLSGQISRDQAQLLQQHQDMVAKWQKANNKKLQELMLLGETVPDELADIRERLLSINTNLSSQLEAEKQNRMHERQVCIQDLSSKLPKAMFDRLYSDVSKQMTELDARISKTASKLNECESAVRTSQTQLSSKVHTETNARMEVAVEVNQRVAKLRGEVDFLLQENQRRYEDMLRTQAEGIGQYAAASAEAQTSKLHDGDSPHSDETGSRKAESPRDDEQEETEEQEESEESEETEESEESEETKEEEEEAVPPDVSPRQAEPIEHRMIFIRPADSEDKETAFNPVNQWGFHNAILFGLIKKRWKAKLKSSTTAAKPTGVDEKPNDDTDETPVTDANENPASTGENVSEEPPAEDLSESVQRPGETSAPDNE